MDNLEQIAAVDGIDSLLVGTNDLCLELGMPGQVGDPEIAAVMERVIDACRRHGKHPGLGGVYEPALMQRYIEMGMRLVLAGSDLSMMMAAARDKASFLRTLTW